MSETKPSLNLIQKLAKVMGSVKHVAKRGRNEFHKYDYSTEADIVDAVRHGLATEGVMIFPSAEELTWREVSTKSGTASVATLRVKFTITDGIDDREVWIYGEGQDSGDKATYKAMTGAVKYYILKQFLIPTGDDPERDVSAETGKRQAKPKAEAPKPEADSEDQPINKAQQKMLFAFLEEHKLSPEALRGVMKGELGIESTKDIKSGDLPKLTLALAALARESAATVNAVFPEDPEEK